VTTSSRPVTSGLLIELDVSVSRTCSQCLATSRDSGESAKNRGSGALRHRFVSYGTLLDAVRPGRRIGRTDVLIVEVGALAVAAVTLLLQRLDKRRAEAAERPDLQRALVALSTSLRKWSAAADGTNREVRAYLRDLTSRDALYESLHAQKALAESRSWLLDSAAETPSEGADETVATLAVYAPEVRDQLARVVAGRHEQLEALDEAVGALNHARRAAYTRASTGHEPLPSDENLEVTDELVANLDATLA
jgi:hypothetical protein